MKTHKKIIYVFIGLLLLALGLIYNEIRDPFDYKVRSTICDLPSLKYSESGDYLCITTFGNNFLFRSDTGEIIIKSPVGPMFSAAAISPDNKYFASKSSTDYLVLYDISAKKEIKRWSINRGYHGGRADWPDMSEQLFFSHDSKYIVMGYQAIPISGGIPFNCYDNYVIWTKFYGILDKPVDNGSLVLLDGAKYNLSLVDIEKKKIIKSIKLPAKGSHDEIYTAQDKAFVPLDDRILIVDIVTSNIREIKINCYYRAFAVSKNASIFAIGAEDQNAWKIQIYKISDGQLISEIPVQDKPEFIALHPEKPFVSAAYRCSQWKRGRVCVYDIVTKKEKWCRNLN